MAQHLAEDEFISTDQCVAYLKLLGAWAKLRNAISRQDGVFGIYDAAAEGLGPNDDSIVRAQIREKRWAVYTARAVQRYTSWWDTCIPTDSSIPMQSAISDAESYKRIVFPTSRIRWKEMYLPPLDVLMVWHAHMLSPQEYLEDCIRHGKMGTWASDFPWQLVNSQINDTTLEYVPSTQAQDFFETQLGLQWNNLNDPPVATVTCPSCERSTTVEWTKGDIGSDPQKAFSRCTGFSDSSFQSCCLHCQAMINHDKLKIARFYRDVKSVLFEDGTVAGSQYSIYGIPGQQSTGLPAEGPKHSSLNNFIKTIGMELLVLTDPKREVCRTIFDLKTFLEAKLHDQATLSVTYKKDSSTVKLVDLFYTNRMLMRYWATWNHFSLDLASAVIRQGRFIRDTEHLDWVHFPDVHAIIERFFGRYTAFFSIMRKNPSCIAIPTLDIDLVWHTHLLSPAKYFFYSVRTEDGNPLRLIQHGNTIAAMEMHKAFIWTSKEYRKVTGGEIYSECLCRYCAALREDELYTTLFPSKSIYRARKAAEALHDRIDIPTTCGPHISAHSATPNPEPESAYQADMLRVQQTMLQRMGEKASERMERRRHRQGARRGIPDSFSTTQHVWGFPMSIEFYAPYFPDLEIHGHLYACDPHSMYPGLTGKLVDINNNSSDGEASPLH
ncbi:hypothetical protein PHISCL_05893 [Aspergillus sclerotialis]|uniref:Alpha-ketoglutarate-dependent sulfonate dioxygenase n=1 Tax=Aspergillus sclerotialis TaxID=2070753 RepID=A0A3A2ZR54_9EURO|nr:hypothetical protein PHISCL_05893 [Aspergillus sclerotialis]